MDWTSCWHISDTGVFWDGRASQQSCFYLCPRLKNVDRLLTSSSSSVFLFLFFFLGGGGGDRSGGMPGWAAVKGTLAINTEQRGEGRPPGTNRALVSACAPRRGWRRTCTNSKWRSSRKNCHNVEIITRECHWWITWNLNYYCMLLSPSSYLCLSLLINRYFWSGDGNRHFLSPTFQGRRIFSAVVANVSNGSRATACPFDQSLAFFSFSTFIISRAFLISTISCGRRPRERRLFLFFLTYFLCAVNRCFIFMKIQPAGSKSGWLTGSQSERRLCPFFRSTDSTRMFLCLQPQLSVHVFILWILVNVKSEERLDGNPLNFIYLDKRMNWKWQILVVRGHYNLTSIYNNSGSLFTLGINVHFDPRKNWSVYSVERSNVSVTY